MINNNPAPTNQPILDAIKNRWSPLAFADNPVSEKEVNILLESASWSSSAYNEQPWQYAVGYRGDDIYVKIAETLVDGNAWARTVPVLLMSISKTYFEHGHRPNRHYGHDTGAANQLMHIQATSMGLYIHQMSGFDTEKARELLNIDDEHDPITIIAVGYPGDPSDLSPEMRERQEAVRQRKPLDEMLWIC